MKYEDAVEQYWKEQMEAGHPRLRISQPSKALSRQTRNGWKLYNVGGFLGEIRKGGK